MDNIVRRIREALDLNQSDFGRKIGRSHQSVQAYERTHAPLTVDVARKIRQLAAQNTLGSLLVEFDRAYPKAKPENNESTPADWQVSKVLFPSGHALISGKTAQQQTRSYKPENLVWHDMLEEILNSGNLDATGAVQPNILLFHKYVRHVNPSRVGTKAAGATKKNAV